MKGLSAHDSSNSVNERSSRRGIRFCGGMLSVKVGRETCEQWKGRCSVSEKRWEQSGEASLDAGMFRCVECQFPLHEKFVGEALLKLNSEYVHKNKYNIV